MTINSKVRSIYQNAIDSKFGYDLISMTHYGVVGVGTNNPEKYSNCLSFTYECQSSTLSNCQSYIVKKGIGKNHEFIDAPLAALFLNNHKIEIFFTKYPRDGYNMEYVSDDKLSILGTASPLICNFKSLTDIIKPYALDNKGDPNINLRGFNRSGYLNELKGYFNKTEPQSITDYYVSQYISGGGDPNPGNIGFVKVFHIDENQYDYVITKVDLGASFKNYSQISGSQPTLEFNNYAFTIDYNVKNFRQLYEHVIKDGNILMPGSAYECEPRSTSCQWSGQGNIGLYNGQYKKSSAYGINMDNYVKKHHLQDSLTKLCKTSKEDIINIFSSSALKIHELLYNAVEKNRIPVINESEEMFNQYIDGRSNFISSRYDQLCNLMIESNREDNIEKANDDNNEPLSYPWYDYNSPDFYSNILLGLTTVTAIMAVTCCIIKIN